MRGGKGWLAVGSKFWQALSGSQERDLDSAGNYCTTEMLLAATRGSRGCFCPSGHAPFVSVRHLPS